MILYNEFNPKKLTNGTTKLGMYLVELVNESKFNVKVKFCEFLSIVEYLMVNFKDLDAPLSLIKCEDADLVAASIDENSVNEFLDSVGAKQGDVFNDKILERVLIYLPFMDDYDSTKSQMNDAIDDVANVVSDYISSVKSILGSSIDMLFLKVNHEIAEEVFKLVSGQLDKLRKRIKDPGLLGDPTEFGLYNLISLYSVTRTVFESLLDTLGLSERKVFADHIFIDQFSAPRTSFADYEEKIGKGIEAEDLLSDELKDINDESKDAFIKLVTDEFGKLTTTDELITVMEVVDSYKNAIFNGKSEFYWSYTAPINKLACYRIQGKKIVQS